MSDKNNQQNMLSEIDDMELLDFDAMENLLSKDMDSLLGDIELLEDEKALVTNPDRLGTEIYNSIFNQLGAQSGLDISGEMARKEYKNDKEDKIIEKIKIKNKKNGEETKKITESDIKKAATTEALRDDTYQTKRKKNTKASQTSEGITDAYTGKKIRVQDGHQVNTDHVVSRNEIYGEGIKKRFREFSGKTVSDLANGESNLVATTESLNKSKGKKSTTEYTKETMQRRKDLEVNFNKSKEKILADPNLSDAQKQAAIKEKKIRYQDKIDANSEMMEAVDKKARKDINKQMVGGAVKNATKEMATAAARSILMGSAATLVKNVIDSLVEFFKIKKKSFKQFTAKIKEAISKFFSSLKTIFKNSASAASSSIMNNLMSILMEPVKKIWSGIKNIFSTVKSALKIFFSAEHKEKPLSIRIAEVGKVLTAGLVMSGVIIFSEVITEFLEKIFPPLKGLTIPIIGSVTGFIVEIFLGIVGGILTGIVINQLNKFIQKKTNNESNKKILANKNKVLDNQHIHVNIVKEKMVRSKKESSDNITKNHQAAKEMMDDSLNNIFDESVLPMKRNLISDNQSDFDQLQSDLDGLL